LLFKFQDGIEIMKKMVVNAGAFTQLFIGANIDFTPFEPLAMSGTLRFGFSSDEESEENYHTHLNPHAKPLVIGGAFDRPLIAFVSEITDSAGS
jgi:hypothetical protein